MRKALNRQSLRLLQIALFGFLLMHTQTGLAQTWTTVKSNPPMTQVFMLSSTVGWSVGGQGAIRSTTDGSNWSIPAYPTTQDLYAVWAADANNVWAVGFAGTILKWNGSTWATQTSGTTNNLYGVWSTDASNVWAVGIGGKILKWNGSSWSVQTSGTTSDLRGIWGTDSTNIWAVGTGGTILKWNGTGWSAATSGTTNPILAVWGTGANQVWAVGLDGMILYWDGTIWSPQVSNTTSSLFGIAGVNATNVWAVGSSGAIVKFDGSVWTPQTSGTTSGLQGIAALSSTKAFAVGFVGGYLQWNGTSWSQGAGVVAELRSVWGSDSNNVWAVGAAPLSYKWNSNSWSAQSSGSSSRLQGMSGSSANSIWAVGESGSISKWNGTAWTAQTSNTTANLFGVWAANANNVWAVGKSGTIMFWNGSYWEARSSGTTNALQAAWGTDANNVWAVGVGGTLLKWNGTSWATQTSGTTVDLTAITGTSASSIWVVGSGGVIRFWNGSTWATQSSGTTQNLKSVWAADASNVWAVGDSGTLLKWNGSAWSAQSSGTVQNLTSVWGSSATYIFAVGDYGTTVRLGSTPPPLPTVGIPSVSGLTSSSAIFIDSVNANGTSTVVTLEYGLTDQYGSTTTAWESPVSGSQTVRAQVSGLAPGTTYHYMFKAVSSAGTVTSADRTFVTNTVPTGAPTVSTQSPSFLRSTSVTLNGIANATGSSNNLDVDFEFGTTTNYNRSFSASPFSVTGSSDTAFTGTVSGLTASTTYHYRSRIQGPVGYIYGADMVFTTPAFGFPSATAAAASAITATSATLNGFVSTNAGPSVTAAFEYGLDTSYGSTAAVSGTFSSSNFTAVSKNIPITGANVTYHYRLKATNANGTAYGPDTTFVTPDPHDARLSGIALSTGSLHPVLASNTTDYTIDVPYETTGLTVTPTSVQTAATIDVMGNPSVLPVGDKTVTLFVTAADRTTTKTYTLVITRAAPKTGSLDLSFNGTGKVTTALSTPGGFGYKTVIQPDGRILVAGYANLDSTADQFALARYNPDGSLDTTFNGTGKVTTAVRSTSDLAFNLALQNDGKILLVGQSSDGTFNDFAVVRYNSNGTLDTTFNGTGKVVTSMGIGDDTANDVAVQADGKIVVVGRASDGTREYFAVVRYNSNGSLDTTFNSADHSGKVITDVGSYNDFASSVAIQSDGKLVVIGGSLTFGSYYDIAVVRYNSDGGLDTDFNLTGKAITHLSNSGALGYEVHLQNDGMIVVSGAVQNSNWDMALLRYDTTGQLDPGFGSGGMVITNLGSGNDWGNSFAIQSDGKIVVGGNSDNPHTFSVVRYFNDGNLDTTFGAQGMVTTSFGVLDEGGYGVGLQDDGKIVVSGYAGDFANYKFALARYLGNGPAIAVQQTGGANLFDGLSTADFSGVFPGDEITRTFTISNTSLAPLTGLSVTIDGAAFNLIAQPLTSLSSFDSTTFTVRFAPTTTGAKTGMIHIATNVLGNNSSYDIAIKGLGFTQLDSWRQTLFPGSTATSGPGADLATPQNDGVTNLMKFATGLDPSLPCAMPGEVTTSSSQLTGITFVYTRSKAALFDGITFAVEWSDTLASGSWSQVGVTESVVTQGETEVVTVSVPSGSAGHRFVHLVVMRP